MLTMVAFESPSEEAYPADGSVLPAFVKWLETAPPERRAGAADLLASAFLHEAVAPSVRAEIEAAMTLLLDDPAPEVRFALASGLAASPHAPRHIVTALVAAETETAGLILSTSPAFSDAELVDIAAEACDLHQLIIAARPLVSAAVAAAIAEVGGLEACLALLENGGATITAFSLKRLAERFVDVPEMRAALDARPGLPAEVRQILAREESREIEKARKAELRAAHDRARDRCDQATILIAAEAAPADLLALVEHLRVTEQLTASLILRAVSSGNIAFFEAAVAILADVPIERVRTLVRAGQLAAVRAIYGQAKLPSIAFEAFAVAIEVWLGFDHRRGPAERYRLVRLLVDEVLARYRSVSDTEMNELTAMLRRFAADTSRAAAREFARANVEKRRAA